MDGDESAYKPSLLPITRRRFMQGCVAGTAMSLLEPAPILAQGRHPSPSELSGTDFDLTIDYLPVNFAGRHVLGTAVNGSVPGPTLRWREGDTVNLRVTNRLKSFSSSGVAPLIQ